MKIIIPLFIKFLGMGCLFLAANLTINQIGLDMYGIYSQTISLSMFFMSLASLGFAQSFIRKSANLEISDKLNLFYNQNKIVFTNSIILLPLLYIILDKFLEKDFVTIFIVLLFFLILSTFRLRFSFIRTTKLVKFAELPDMIIRQLSFVLLIYFFGLETETDLYFFAMIALLLAYTSQAVIVPGLKFIKNHRLKSLGHYKKHVEKNDLKIWFFNSLVQLKEFLELSLIIFAVGALAAGQYKLLVQFSLVFMSIFNSLNLVNSALFAKLIDDSNLSQIREVASAELKQGLLFYASMFFLFTLFTYFLDIFSFFSLPDDSYKIFYLILMFSLLNLLFGPVTQLCIHLKQLNLLNFSYLIRLALIFPITLMSAAGYNVSLMFIVLWLFMLEFTFLATCSFQLSKKYGLYPALLLALRKDKV